MANGIKIGTNSIGGVYIGSSSASSVYLGTTLIYSGGTPPTPPTPTGSTCYEVISTPITSYTSTTYDSVYSFADSRWYMLNNLNGYEEYGVYDSTGSSLSDYTYYDGKLVAIGTTEYQRSGGTWVEVGTYEDESVTYTIYDRDPYAYEGQTLSTTFKIPVVDVETLGGVNFSIRDNNDGELNITLAEGWTDYIYRDSEWNEYNGTVTNDGEYFYLSLPSEEPQSIIIEYINYDNSTPIHIIVSSQQASVEYSAKTTPISSVYSSVADMNSVGCPTVGVGQYGVVGNDAYQFDGEDWNSVSNYKLIEKNTDEKANVLLCNSSTELIKAEAQPSNFNNITDVVLGDCVTSIGNAAFWTCGGLTTCTIGSGVTSIGSDAFYYCSGLTSIVIPNSVTSIGGNAFYDCRNLTSITVNATTPPTLGRAVFGNTNDCPIYVPSASVNAYKRATNWSTYASRITAIPNS